MATEYSLALVSAGYTAALGVITAGAGASTIGIFPPPMSCLPPPRSTTRHPP